MRLIAVFIAACGIAAVAIGPATASEEYSDLGGGPASPPDSFPQVETPQTQARSELARLYAQAQLRSSAGEDLFGTASARSQNLSYWSAYNSAQASYVAKYGDELPVPASTASLSTPVGGSVVPMATGYTSRNLGVTWVRQEQSYYCGPATALMILKYRGFTSSAYVSGVSLSQYNLAGSAYLKTNSQGYTTTWLYADSGYTLNDMSRGLNRWAYGTLSGGFAPDKIDSSSELKDIVGYSIDASRPFAVSTYEAANGAHYNSHPVSREIGHWVVVHGYNSSGATTLVADPASGISGYTASAQKFSISTSSLYNFAAGRYSVW